MDRILRIGTRGSPLALAQANEVRNRLAAAVPALARPDAVEIVPIRTTGDRLRSLPLADAGGKGLFTKEIEEALLAGTVDVAVHSMKDVPTWLPDGLVIDCILPREDPRDVLVSRAAASIGALPQGAVVGTASLRRQAVLLHRRPDLRVVPFRGNVETRLRRIDAGEADATVLALAGLKRIGRADAAAGILAPEEMLPAVCQGAIGAEHRADDAETAALLARIDDPPSHRRIACERALLAGLDGSCRTPIAALAEISGDRLTLRALIARPDGSALLETEQAGSVADAEAIGAAAAAALRARAGPGFFDNRS